jgi:hypothetical protein
MWWQTEKYPCPCWAPNSSHTAHSLVTILTQVPWLPLGIHYALVSSYLLSIIYDVVGYQHPRGPCWLYLQCEVTSQHGPTKCWYPTTSLHGIKPRRPQIKSLWPWKLQVLHRTAGDRLIEVLKVWQGNTHKCQHSTAVSLFQVSFEVQNRSWNHTYWALN